MGTAISYLVKATIDGIGNNENNVVVWVVTRPDEIIHYSGETSLTSTAEFIFELEIDLEL